MKRSEVLDRAKDCVTRDRAATHGRAEDTFGLIAAFWSAYLGIPISAVDVTLLMCSVKLARAKGNPGHADNWVDLAGYAAIGAELGVDRSQTGAGSEPAPLVDWEGLINQVAAGALVQDVAQAAGVSPFVLADCMGRRRPDVAFRFGGAV